MNFRISCLQKDLEKYLSYAEHIITSRTTVPILSSFLFRASSNTLTVCATDLENCYSAVFPVDVEVAGEVLVHGKVFLEIVKKFDGETAVALELQEDNAMKILFEDDKTEYSLYVVAKSEFPKIHEFPEGSRSVRIRQADLKRVISKTLYATAQNDPRYFLTGVYFKRSNNELHVVATDAKRLSFINHELEESGEDFSGIIASKSLQGLLKILHDEGTCEMVFAGERVFFRMGNIELSSTLLDGEFPDYTRVIPQKGECFFCVDKELFNKAIQRVSTLSNTKTTQISLELGPRFLTLCGINSDYGKAKGVIPVEYEGETLTISLNYRYLLEALHKISSDKICVYISGSEAPILLQGVDEAHYNAVIMPMKQE